MKVKTLSLVSAITLALGVTSTMIWAEDAAMPAAAQDAAQTAEDVAKQEIAEVVVPDAKEGEDVKRECIPREEAEAAKKEGDAAKDDDKDKDGDSAKGDDKDGDDAKKGDDKDGDDAKKADDKDSGDAKEGDTAEQLPVCDENGNPPADDATQDAPAADGDKPADGATQDAPAADGDKPADDAAQGEAKTAE